MVLMQMDWPVIHCEQGTSTLSLPSVSLACQGKDQDKL